MTALLKPGSDPRLTEETGAGTRRLSKAFRGDCNLHRLPRLRHAEIIKEIIKLACESTHMPPITYNNNSVVF